MRCSNTIHKTSRSTKHTVFRAGLSHTDHFANPLRLFVSCGRLQQHTLFHAGPSVPLGGHKKKALHERRTWTSWLRTQSVASQSPLQIPCYYNREINGEFCRIRPLTAIFTQREFANSMVCGRIPWKTEQGIIGRAAGKKNHKQGLVPQGF